MTGTEIVLRLRAARHRAGLKQREIGLAIGISDKAVSSYESGRCIDRIRLRHLIAYANACGMTLVEFLTFELTREEMDSESALSVVTAAVPTCGAAPRRADPLAAFLSSDSRYPTPQSSLRGIAS